MSTARHHNEWMQLVPNSGPFLSMPVLMRVFPQGLVAHDPDLHRNLRMAHEEWEASQESGRPDRAIHMAWVKFVLKEVLELGDEVLLGVHRLGELADQLMGGGQVVRQLVGCGRHTISTHRPLGRDK